MPLKLEEKSIPEYWEPYKKKTEIQSTPDYWKAFKNENK
jgi:hypothetical protein